MAIIYIHTIAELQLIGNDPGYPSTGQYELANDIDASSIVFVPITTFSGELNGAGYTISDLYISIASNYVGIFKEIIGATISNLNITNARVYNSWVYTSILAGISTGSTIENCNISGEVQGTSYVGGITGYGTSYSTFTDCIFSGILTATSHSCGGFIAYSGGHNNFENCSVIDSSLISPDEFLAGFIGWSSYDTFNNCAVENITIESHYFIGGMVGRATYLTITNCHTTGSILITSDSTYDGYYVGGLVGEAGSGSIITDSYSTCNLTRSSSSTRKVQYFGGLVGDFYGSSIANCYTTGDIYALDAGYTGGFVGRINSGSVTNCYSSGDMTVGGGETYIGGFCSYISSYSGTISYCYSTCNITGVGIGSNSGGFVGSLSSISSLSYCFYKGSIILDTSTSPSNIGGFVGYLSTSSPIHHCFSYCTLYAPTAGMIGGFGGYVYGNIEQCFSLGELTCSHYMAGGLIGFFFNSITDCYSLCNVNYIGPSVGSTYREVDCQDATDSWCQEILSSSYYNNYFTASFSSSGMDLIYIADPAPDTVYIEDNFPFMVMDVSSNMQYSIYIDFTAKGSGQDPSILSYGIFDAVPALMCGFEIKTYSTNSQVEIIAYNGGITSTIFTENNSFNTLFSLKYKKLGVISNFYINDVLVGTIEGQNQSTYSVDALKLSLLGINSTEWIISKLGFENLSEYTSSPLTSQNTGGLLGFAPSNPTLNKCYSAGNVIPY